MGGNRFLLICELSVKMSSLRSKFEISHSGLSSDLVKLQQTDETDNPINSYCTTFAENKVTILRT